jgi:hypothetical protein
MFVGAILWIALNSAGVGTEKSVLRFVQQISNLVALDSAGVGTGALPLRLGDTCGCDRLVAWIDFGDYLGGDLYF